MKAYLFIASLIFILGACNNASISNNSDSANAVSVVNSVDPFNDYWEKGLAEITTYDLKQARYGEIHEGIANTIFVTEPFSKSKQVKLDNPSANPSDNAKVLKLNFTRKFFTGVYPYSTMLSIFTPTNQKKYPNSLKAVFSSQEWCGQTFTQLNLADNGYKVESFSYFESEGDINTRVEKVVLEDELWTMLRIDPKSLPTGEFKAIPGLTFSRLTHKPVTAILAKAEMIKGDATSTYNITYPSIGRSLVLEFNSSFPFEIVKWEEKGFSGYGSNRRELSTTATVKSRKMLDYWNKNSTKDAKLRDELGL